MVVDRSRSAAGAATNDAAFGAGTGIYTTPQAGMDNFDRKQNEAYAGLHQGCTIAVPRSVVSKEGSVTGLSSGTAELGMSRGELSGLETLILLPEDGKQVFPNVMSS